MGVYVLGMQGSTQDETQFGNTYKHEWAGKEFCDCWKCQDGNKEEWAGGLFAND